MVKQNEQAEQGCGMRYHSKTERLKEIFLNDLSGGRFKGDGGGIPSALHLSGVYGVSRNTVRRMLSELSEEGVLSRCVRQGFTAALPSVSGEGSAGLPPSGKHPVLGWFYSGSRDQLIVERTKGIERFAEENHLELRVASGVSGHQPILDLLNHVQDCGIDGVIVANHPLPRYAETLNRLSSAGFPLVVACGQPPEDCPLHVVAEDDFHGIYSATAYLAERHDCPVWFLGGAGNCEVRIKAFQQAMCDAGLVEESERHVRMLKPEMDASENWDMRQKMLLPGKLIRPFLYSLKCPVGIVCANDYIAFGVYEASKELGLKVGEDVFVTGFSDLPFSRRLNPPLTTVHVDYEKLGYQAAWLLHQQILGQITVPTRLLITAAVRERLSC